MSQISPLLKFLLLLLLHLSYHRAEPRHERRYPELKKHNWHERASAVERFSNSGRHLNNRHGHHTRHHAVFTTTTTQSPYDALLKRLPSRDHHHKTDSDYDNYDLKWFNGRKRAISHHKKFPSYQHRNSDVNDYDNYDAFDDENDDLDPDYGFAFTRSKKPHHRATTLAPRSLDTRRDFMQSASENADYEYYDDEEYKENTDNMNAEMMEYNPRSGISLTEYKWRQLGTSENVDRDFMRLQQKNKRHHSHREMLMLRKDVVDRATAHAQRMHKALRCGVPLPRVINVRSEHRNSAAKSYLPRCTLLHRCGEDAGCCREDEICAPSKTRIVHLYFHTVSLNNKSSVERLSFVNHTECACVDRRVVPAPEEETDTSTMDEDSERESNERSQAMSVIKVTESPLESKANPQGLSRRSAATSHGAGVHNVQETQDEEGKFQKEQQDILRRCRCPSQFSAHLLQDGECQCDCFEGQKDCARIKRGKEYFGITDRICIQRGDCRLPQCEFGAYKRPSGRCPRRQEKLEAMGRYGKRSLMFD